MKIKKSGELIGHAGAVYTIDYSNEYLYSGSADGFVTRWSLVDYCQDQFAIKFQKPVYQLKISPDARTLFVGLSNGDFHVFDLIDRKEIKYFTQHKVGIFSISINVKRNQLYLGDADGNISVWDLDELSLMLYLPLNCGKIRNIVVDDLGGEMVVCGQDGKFRVFETAGFNETQTIDSHKGGVSAGFFHQNGSFISAGKDALIKIWSRNFSDKLIEFPGHKFIIYDFLYLPELEVFISVSRDHEIKLWNASNLDFITSLNVKAGGHKYSVNRTIRIDNHRFATCSDDKKVVVWKIESFNDDF